MRNFFILLFGLLCNVSFAQSPQFAVVRPDGTTYMCPTWDSAYNKAVDDDNIYLPGVTISNPNITVNKKLTIYGTGHYPDSTTATGKTIFAGSITILKKVHLEGFEINSSIEINNSGNNSSFVRIKASTLNFSGTSGHFINQCVFSAIGSNNPCSPIDNILVSNSILTGFYNITNSVFQNCIFLGNNCFGCWSYMTSANTTFRNNIFHGFYGIDWYYSYNCFPLVGNSCYNNIFTKWQISNAGSGNFTDVNFDTIFVNQTGASFDYQHNYHLRPNGPFLNAGDDGTQIGLYGGTSFKEGAVPSNPHIYFKQIDSQTGSDGKLKVQVKVRTNN